MRGPNDVGGLEAGPLDTRAHDLTFWEKQIDAMHMLLRQPGRRHAMTDVNRFYIESLGHEAYRTLSYYERWTASLCRQLIETGVLTQDEIDAKVCELRSRLGRDLVEGAQDG
ncbi:MAG TPA: nitrile hydratase [Beijerinckiaceae bacterium]|nr:nitrile hydratase [Beijerinckiaceae bacterium]